MKKILLLFILLIPVLLFAQQELSWDFPVKPGTTEWGNLKSYAERLNVYNVPDSILSKLTTKELAIICLKYPEFRLLNTRNNLQKGYKYLKGIFNGFSELENRKDSGRELLDIYLNYTVEDVKNGITSLDKGKEVIRFTNLEILLAQKDFLKNLSLDDLRKLQKKCLKIYEDKKLMMNDFGFYGLHTTVLIVARINSNNLTLTKSEFGVVKFNNFIDNSIVYEPSILDAIISEVKSLEN